LLVLSMNCSYVGLELENVSFVFDTEFFIFGIYVADLSLDLVLFLNASDDLVKVSF